MNILRYLLATIAVIAVGTWISVTYYPELDFVQYVPDVLLGGVGAITVLTAIALYTEGRVSDNRKKLLMAGLFLAVFVPSVFATTAFLHEAQTTWTKGEVHYHADFEVVVDGEQLDLIGPKKFCNTMSRESTYMCSVNDRVGTTEYHEHSDDRIHLEGTFKTKRDAALAAFFEAFRGELTGDTLHFPTNDGWVNVTEEDGNTLKIVMLRGVGKARGWCVLGEDVDTADTCIDPYSDDHVTDPAEYVISPHQRDPQVGGVMDAVLDKIWIIYDDTPVEDALADLREDNSYTYKGQTVEMTKSAAGYGE